MKRIILLLASAFIFCAPAFSFTQREHAAIAVIAERYLTPEASSACKKIFRGETLAMYASYPDQYRQVMLDAEGNKYPHIGECDADFKPIGGVYFVILDDVKLLKNYKNLDPKLALEALGRIVHFVGDMHCPSHVKYPKGTTPKTVKNYIYNGKKIQYHAAWDSNFTSITYAGGVLDLAYFADVATPEERAQYQKGDVLEWAEDCARFCFPFTRDLELNEEREVEVDRPYVTEHGAFAKTQIMKAGYRLAALLNEMFK